MQKAEQGLSCECPCPAVLRTRWSPMIGEHSAGPCIDRLDVDQHAAWARVRAFHVSVLWCSFPDTCDSLLVSFLHSILPYHAWRHQGREEVTRNLIFRILPSTPATLKHSRSFVKASFSTSVASKLSRSSFNCILFPKASKI